MRAIGVLFGLLAAVPASGSVLLYGTENCLGFGCYGNADPTAGATLEGLAPGAETAATNSYGHSFPFLPASGDFLGTDQIYVGSNQTAAHDGYAISADRIAGPLVLTLDYSSVVPVGDNVDSLTLGLALDDFQAPAIGNPFTVSIDGTPNAAISSFVNSINETGPTVRFFSFGIDPSVDNTNHVVTVSINEGGDGGDGYALDFATVGVTASPAPEPGTIGMLAGGILVVAMCRRIRCN
jgi:hypothetical protein